MPAKPSQEPRYPSSCAPALGADGAADPQAGSGQQLARSLDLLGQVVFEADAGGALVFLSPAWSKLLGYGLADSLGRPLRDFAAPADRGRVSRRCEDPLSAGPGVATPVQMQRADGGIVWVERSTAPLPEGGVVGTLRDVTAEKAARDEADMAASVARNASPLLVLLDRQGRALWVNEAFTKRTGYSLGETASRRPGGILAGPDTDLEEVARICGCLVKGSPCSGDLLSYPRTGEPFWVSFEFSPLPAAEGQADRFVAVLTDSTESRRARGELQAAKARAEQMAVEAQAASLAKSEFLATVSHEIRTPMNGILGMTEMLLHTRLGAHQREMTQTVADSGQVLLRVINDILDFSEMEGGRVTVEQEPFDLKPLVEGVVASVRRSAQGKPVELRVDFDAGVPLRAVGDAVRLRQVLLNLVGNGEKFTATGTVSTRVRRAEPGQGKGVIRFEVRDTGVGIPAAKLGLLFQQFQQLDSSTSRRHGGAGLGLAISRQLVGLMGGRMGVESEPGRGSMFWFELPLAAPAGEDRVAPGRRVLLAQDHDIQRRLSVLLIEKLGWQVESVSTGAEALKRLEEGRFEAVLLGSRLADMAGPELAAAISQRSVPGGRPPRIIALSPAGESGDSTLLVAAGVERVLDLPLTSVQLKEALSSEPPLPASALACGGGLDHAPAG